MNQQQKRSKILLIGDSCYDYYHYGNVNRISSEAPIPILDFKYTQQKFGMAANVNDNLLKLGVETVMISSFTEKKHRYIDIKSGNQLLRIDEQLEFEKFKMLDINKDYDAIIISDYNKGYLTYDDIEAIIKISKAPVFIDTKKPDLKRFEGATLKLNQYEWQDRISDHSNCIVTRGGEPIMYKNTTYFPKVVQVYDVCGAGDTFLSAYVYSGDIEFAMKASSITVQHVGVYSPTLKEIYG